MQTTLQASQSKQEKNRRLAKLRTTVLFFQYRQERPPLLWTRIYLCWMRTGYDVTIADPHDFGLQDPHPESAFQMRIPDADADPE